MILAVNRELGLLVSVNRRVETGSMRTGLKRKLRIARLCVRLASNESFSGGAEVGLLLAFVNHAVHLLCIRV